MCVMIAWCIALSLQQHYSIRVQRTEMQCGSNVRFYCIQSMCIVNKVTSLFATVNIARASEDISSVFSCFFFLALTRIFTRRCLVHRVYFNFKSNLQRLIGSKNLHARFCVWLAKFTRLCCFITPQFLPRRESFELEFAEDGNFSQKGKLKGKNEFLTANEYPRDSILCF